MHSVIFPVKNESKLWTYRDFKFLPSNGQLYVLDPGNCNYYAAGGGAVLWCVVCGVWCMVICSLSSTLFCSPPRNSDSTSYNLVLCPILNS